MNDLSGKVILITGATEGIGKAAAQQFAERGATLIIVARNKEKGERVLKALGGNTSLMLADMSSIAQVKKLAAEFIAKYDRLDVLVNNAGALIQSYQLSADGIEMTFALNHVGYQLLSMLLTPLLEKTPGSRVVSTASGAHASSRLDLKTVVKRNGKAGFAAYADSKVANILFTRELANHLPNSLVTCFHPGFVHTGFGTGNSAFVSGAIQVAAKLFARTPQKGAETLVWLATADGVTSGEYYKDKQPTRRTRLARNDAVARELWALTETLVQRSSS